jgi:phosphatidylinositol-3-phosphatase
VGQGQGGKDRRPPGEDVLAAAGGSAGRGVEQESAMAGVGRWRIAVPLIMAAAVLTGWASLAGGTPPARSGHGPSTPVVRAAAHPRRARAARPGHPRRARTERPSHLIVVVEENHAFEQVIGSPAAPFLNRLAAHGTLLTHYYAIAHPSLPNYVALLSGRTPLHGDCRSCTFAGPTLVDQLQARHITWAAYLQGLPRPCSTVARSGAYTEAVDPFMHAADIRHHPTRCDRVLPFARFQSDLATGRLPTVVFVMPDLHHEMHSGPVRVADRWLGRLVGRLRANRVWRQDTRLVVTFDESNFSDVRSCCVGLGRGGRIPTVVAGPRVRRGHDPTPYTHYSLLRSIEAAFGLPYLGHAGDPATATIPAVVDPSGGGA